jgi:DNA-binding beta-propeller fold protein YncE
MDLNANLVRSFGVQHAVKDEAIGIAVDPDGNVYVSYGKDAPIRVYSSEGKLIGTFGNSGSKAGQLDGPTGLWIDSAKPPLCRR